MKRVSTAVSSFICLFGLAAGAQAATTNTTLTVTNASGTLSGTSVSVQGPATFTNGIGNGTFKSTLSLTSVGSDGMLSADYTITLAGSDSLKGTIKVPLTLLTGGTSGTGSATVTGGTGAYSGATGSFPTLTGTGSLSGTTITVSFTGAGSITTGGGGGGGNTPTITQVADAAAYTNNVAQGSIFIVKGSNLGGSGYQPTSFPLPQTFNNVKITFTPASGGSGTDAYLIYLFNQGGVNQLAAVLPSTLATGNYNVTVTNGSAVSAPFPTQIVQRKFTLLSQDSSGTGLAVVQNIVSATQYDVNRFTTGSVNGVTISPAKFGQGLIAYGTGLGPITGADNSGAPALDSTSAANVKVIVGGMTVTPVYSGRTPGAAGLDQISFILPANVSTGCAVPLQVSVNNVLSNAVFISIAPSASATECVMPGFTTQQLKDFDNGKTWTVGSFALTKITESVPQVGTVSIDSVGGSFSRFTGFQLASAARYAVSTSTQGSCQIFHVVGTSGEVLAAATPTGLDAGTITFNGPAASKISNQTLTQDPKTNSYSLNIATEGIPLPGGPCSGCSITAGTYTLNGAGGKDVGSFNTSITVGPPLTVTGGLPATVTRSAGLPLAWTGGNSSDLVEIIGYSGTTTGSGTNAVSDVWEFICTTTAGTGGFTVPSSVLSQLPAVNASAANSTGFLLVESGVSPVSFTATLSAGGSIDVGRFTAFQGIGSLTSYQ